MKQLQQISAHDCALNIRLLLCQAKFAIGIPITSSTEIQRTPLNFGEKNWLGPNRQKITYG